MKLMWKNHRLLLVSLLLTVILFVSLYFPLHLPGKPSDYTYDGTNIVLGYKIFGCGSLIRTVVKGEDAIYEKANLPAPQSGVYELKFTEDSDEPLRHIDSAEFYTAGLAEKYTYYMSVEIIGISEGAPECCDPKPAYNEIVPLVKVIKWEPTTFTPQNYFTARHYITMLILVPLVLVDICYLIRFLYFLVRARLLKR